MTEDKEKEEFEKNKALVNAIFEYGKKQDNVFLKFICLWMSFNAFYNYLCNTEWDRNCLEKLSEEKDIKWCFGNIFLEEKEKVAISSFHTYINGRPNKWVIDLKNPKVVKYSIIRNFYWDNDGFLNVIYQIRCNLFHGGKKLNDENEEELVGFAANALEIFLKKVYIKYWYI